LTEIDRVTRLLAMSRANFIRAALELALRNENMLSLEQKHAQGYKERPSQVSEFAEWESEQAWGDQ
jgi:metal-responsive CopG/Arc/MetJ family transcriptional regulator